MDSKLFGKLLEAYASVYSQPIVEESEKEDEEDEKEEEKDTKKKSSKKKGEDEEEEEGEEDEMKEEYENLDEISYDLALRASKAADIKRGKLSVAGDKEGAAAKAAQAKRLYDKQATKRLNREEVDVFDEVIEFLYVEGYAETLEEAEWLMANVIDEEAIEIVIGEAQHARENPEKYEREQEKKYAPVRGERTPMPPRGNKRREDFEKWYAKNVR